MKQVLQSYRGGRPLVAEVPAPKPGAGQILVRTKSSLISAGTERATIEFARKSLAAKAASRMDLVAKVVTKARSDGIQETLRMVQSRLDAPVSLGYSCAGEVVALGARVDEFRVGDRVACAGQDYASHAEFVRVPKNLAVRVPDEVSFAAAAYVTLGAIALQGVRQAAAALGESVAVIGLGLIGQITVQLLKASGCSVIGCDPSAARRTLARELGADAVADPEALVDAAQAATAGHGVDAVIVTASTKSDQPIRQAAEISRKKGRIVVVGAVGMNLPREPFYVRELDLRLSMSYGPGRYDSSYEEGGQDYPYAYVRWTEKRNMQAFLGLVRAGRVDVDKLTTHEFDIAAAAEAYRVVTESGDSALGVLLNYPAENSEPRTKKILRPRAGPSAEVSIGLIGAGHHVMDRLVPGLLALEGAAIRGICSATGKTADRVASKLGASYATTDFREVLDDRDIHAVIVGTRHDLHAEIVVAALGKGKHVFVEKPLCLTDAELEAIAAAYAEAAGAGATLFVGYNRRYSRHLEETKTFFSGRHQPLTMLYRVNAGPLPADHWLMDEAVGGGRIIGEGCHFVDVLQRLCGAPIESVFAAAAASDPRGGRDEATITLGFADGSVGTVVYSGSGDKALAKERCEVFGGGASAVIEDFRRTEFYSSGKRRVFTTRLPDKGFAQEMAAFVRSVKDPQAAGQPFQELYAASQATFRAVDSAKTGERYRLPPAPLST